MMNGERTRREESGLCFVQPLSYSCPWTALIIVVRAPPCPWWWWKRCAAMLLFANHHNRTRPAVNDKRIGGGGGGSVSGHINQPVKAKQQSTVQADVQAGRRRRRRKEKEIPDFSFLLLVEKWFFKLFQSVQNLEYSLNSLYLTKIYKYI